MPQQAAEELVASNTAGGWRWLIRFWCKWSIRGNRNRQIAQAGWPTLSEGWFRVIQSVAGDLDGAHRFCYDNRMMVESHVHALAIRRQRQPAAADHLRHAKSKPPNGGIDEIVMVRIIGKGDYYVHQDQHYNVTALTDMSGGDVERYNYTPYSEMRVSQITGPGDYDGDGDVDSTDRAAAESGGTCRGSSPTGACRILDLDFDGDTDDDDLTLFDLLDQDDRREPDLPHSRIGFRFGHQGLLYDAEIESYQNRARQYLPKLKRFAQRDPAKYVDGMSLYSYVTNAPLENVDPAGLYRFGKGCTADIKNDAQTACRRLGILKDACRDREAENDHDCPNLPRLCNRIDDMYSRCQGDTMINCDGSDDCSGRDQFGAGYTYDPPWSSCSITVCNGVYQSLDRDHDPAHPDPYTRTRIAFWCHELAHCAGANSDHVVLDQPGNSMELEGLCGACFWDVTEKGRCCGKIGDVENPLKEKWDNGAQGVYRVYGPIDCCHLECDH